MPSKPWQAPRNGDLRSKHVNLAVRSSPVQHSNGGGVPLPGLREAPLRKTSQHSSAVSYSQTYLHHGSSADASSLNSSFHPPNAPKAAKPFPGRVSNSSPRHNQEADREEGELSENDNMLEQLASVPDSTANGQLAGFPLSSSSTTPHINTSAVNTSLDEQRETSKQFVQAWHRNGYLFDQLVEQNLDPIILGGLYEELGITVRTKSPDDMPNHAVSIEPMINVQQLIRSSPEKLPAPTAFAPSKSGTEGTAHATTSISQASTDIDSVPRSGVQTSSDIRQTTPSPTASLISPKLQSHLKLTSSTADRQDYIARLKAAKLRKSTAQTDAAPIATPQLSPEPAMEQPISTSGVGEIPKLPVDEPLMAPTPTEPAVETEQIPKGAKAATAEPSQDPTFKLAQLRRRALESTKLALAAKAARASSAGQSNPLKPLKVAAAVAPQSIMAEQSADSQTAQDEPLLSRQLPIGPSETQHGNSILSRQAKKPMSFEISSAAPSAPIIRLDKLHSPSSVPTPPLVTNRIPGLFMTLPATTSDMSGNGKKEADQVATMGENVSQVTGRKRPVALDFDDESSNSGSKRLFGYPRGYDYDETIIIEASDNESEDVEPRESGSLVLTDDATIQAQRFLDTALVNQHAVAGNHDIVTSSSIQPQPDISDQHLKSREAQILAMKRKIAEMERKRLAKSQASGSGTPTIEKSQLGVGALAEPPSITQSPALATSQFLSTRQSPKIDSRANIQAQTKVAPYTITAQDSTAGSTNRKAPDVVQAEEQSKALVPTGRQDEHDGLLQWKQQRRLQLQAGLPALDANYASNQKRLAMLRAQMDELQAELNREDQEKQRLTREMEDLGVETEGQSIDGLRIAHCNALEMLSAKEDILMAEPSTASSPVSQLRSMAHSPVAFDSLSEKTPLDHSGEAEQLSVVSSSLPDTGAEVNSPSDSMDEAMDETEAISAGNDEAAATMIEGEEGIIHDRDPTSAAQTPPAIGSSSPSASAMDLDDSEPTDVEIGLPHAPSDQQPALSPSPVETAGPSALDEAVVVPAPDKLPGLRITRLPYPTTEEDLAQLFRDFPVVSIEVNLNPRKKHTRATMRVVNVMEAKRAVATLNGSRFGNENIRVKLVKPQKRGAAVDRAPSEKEDEGIPLEEALYTDLFDVQPSDQGPTMKQPSIEYSILDQPLQSLATPAAESEGEYEPPDNSEVIREAPDDVSDQSDQSDYEPPDAIQSSVMSSPLPTELAYVDGESAPAENTPDVSGASSRSESRFHDAAQSSPGDVAQKGSTVNPPNVEYAVAQTPFTPYVSPLTRFKAYRFHPDFESSVPTGLQSTTYSHSIDAENPICSYETAGGVCNDGECDAQHFRAMTLSENEILRQIGTSIPQELDQTQRQDYVTGLAEVVNNVRERNVEGSAAITSEILAYRRTFMLDAMKTLTI